MNAHAILTGLLLAGLSCTPKSGADIILHSGLILSMDRYMPPAQALAIVDGRILAVGRNVEIMPLANWKTRKINLKGAVVLPGLTDSHFHLLGFGRSLETLQLVGTTSAREIADRVAAQVANLPKGAWLTGRGWDQNDWEVTEFPDRDLLDRAAPDHPVALRRIDGHALWVNSQALELAGIDARTADPEGGFIHRRDDGAPTGVLIDNAKAPVNRAIPAATRADIRRQLAAAVARCNQVGLTTIHDPGVGQTTLDVIREMIDAGEFPLRYYGMLNGSDPELLKRHFADGPTLEYKDRLTVRSVKLYADGALGSRGAALLSPYSDDPGNRGLLVTSRQDLEQTIAETFEAGFQPAVHAIGDRAVRIALDIYEKLLPPGKDHDLRPRIEHAQMIARSDIKRFGEMGVVPAMQPTHATSDMYWAEERVGPTRIRGAYAWKSLLETGVFIAGGSDCPVEQEEPLLQIYAARTRQDTTGWPEDGWYASEAMTGLAAARSMTTWAAYAAFQDSVRGKILPGYDADLTILSRNPVGSEAQVILKTEVLTTMIGGETVWRNAAAWRKLPLPPQPGESAETDSMAAIGNGSS